MPVEPIRTTRPFFLQALAAVFTGSDDLVAAVINTPSKPLPLDTFFDQLSMLLMVSRA